MSAGEYNAYELKPLCTKAGARNGAIIHLQLKKDSAHERKWAIFFTKIA